MTRGTTRTFTLSIAFLLATTLGWAGEGKQKTVSGCLTQIGSDYVLTEAGGKSFHITGTSADLDQNLGKKVEVRGEKAHKAGSTSDMSQTEATSSAAEQHATALIRAESVNVIEQRCDQAIALVPSEGADTAATTGVTGSTDVTDDSATARADADMDLGTTTSDTARVDTDATAETESDRARAETDVTTDATADTDANVSTESAQTTTTPDPMTTGPDAEQQTATAPTHDPMTTPQTGTENPPVTPDTSASTTSQDTTESARVESDAGTQDPSSDTARVDADIEQEPMGQQSDATTVKGCLTRDSATGAYTLRADDGRTFQVREQNADLSQFDGQKVNIETTSANLAEGQATSTEGSATTSPDTTATAGASIGSDQLHVRRIQSAGESCGTNNP